jgi:hypothetical protein
MKGRRIIFLFFFLATACLDPYNPPGDAVNYGYLVVDSFVSSTDGTGTVLLSRTKPLDSKDSIIIVSNAQVSLEVENGGTLPFVEMNPGKYELTGASIDASTKYRLKILSAGKTYQSDFVPVVNTPPMDSVTWKQTDADMVEIYVNTHDANNNTHYYRWRYDETWRYTSAFFSSFIYDMATRSVKPRPTTDDIYDCYQNHTSSGIIISSTIKLQSDIVENMILTSFPINAIRMQHLYSINVRQQALTKEQFEYFEQLKKTTENLGSLFDPQPSQITGNIHCINDPSALAIGYFSLGSVDTKRIFVSPLQVDFHKKPVVDPFYNGCVQDTLLTENIPNFSGIQLLTSPVYAGPVLIGYEKSAVSCVDCRLAGGTNVKPAFWP